jgi:acyl-coenzyme A synthetase/AMP-(fatty) acid ligase/acyl carrier protein
MDPEADGPTIHELIEARVAKSPDSIAVVSPARALTYRSLNDEANRLARVILEQAPPPDLPIVVCATGAVRVVALLAALKAGRYSVSLDPADPPARLRSVIQSLRARAIIADDASLAMASELVPDAVAVLNADASPEAGSAGDLRLPIRPDALARIVLTSGSTGEPKAIMQTHRATLFGAITRNNAVHLCSDDRLLVGASAFTELWRPLFIGATLYFFDFKGDDIKCLRRWIDGAQISTFRSTPSVFRQLVTTLALRRGGARSDENLFPSLRVIELMGEPVSWECVELYRRHFSRSCILINFLGCKEVLDYCAYYIDHGTNATEAAVPAGFALPGASVTLVDEAGKAVERRAIGEIAVKIPSASPGYWRRPDLTNERFRHDSSDDGRRICMTGDLGLLLSDHGLICMGRRDSTVKIRGHRVDVAYLEQVLHDLRSVKAAAVVVKTGDQQDLRLVAFIVARPPGHLTDRELRHELAARLPSFMIPSEFLFLEELPTTPMGKIDRQNLRLLAAASQPQTRAIRLPRNRIGKDIAAIWAQVLNVDRVGMRDDFFDLGGDSLMVMQVCARIEQQFEIEFPLSTLFKFRTVVELVPHVAEKMGESGRAPGPDSAIVGAGSFTRRDKIGPTAAE